MNDVPVVEVSHEHETDEGEGEGEELLAVGQLLRGVEERPEQVINLEDEEEWHVGRRQVENEALLVRR